MAVNWKRSTVAAMLGALVGVIALGGFVGYSVHQNVRSKLARQECKSIVEALRLFALHCGRFPTSEEGIVVLYRNPGIRNWQGPYLLSGNTSYEARDPWGQSFNLVASGGIYSVISVGPDGVSGSRDDIIETVGPMIPNVPN